MHSTDRGPEQPTASMQQKECFNHNYVLFFWSHSNTVRSRGSRSGGNEIDADAARVVIAPRRRFAESAYSQF